MPVDDPYAFAARHLRAAKHIVVFTGAGVSAESGIPTFRDDGGFWTEFPPEIYATWSGIRRAALKEPHRLAEFVHAVIGPIARAEPNAGHRAIAELQNHARVTVITQNIDGLHQVAGSNVVHEVHGSMFDVVTLGGRRIRTIARIRMRSIAERVRRAKYGPASLARLLLAVHPMVGAGLRGIYRPNLVLFGDAMAEPAWSNALAAARSCDCLVSVGTSGLVLPAAMIPSEAKHAGAAVIHIDSAEGGGDIWLRGSAADVLPRLVDHLK